MSVFEPVLGALWPSYNFTMCCMAISGVSEVTKGSRKNAQIEVRRLPGISATVNINVRGSLAAAGFATATEMENELVNAFDESLQSGDLSNALSSQCVCSMVVEAVQTTAARMYPSLAPSALPTFLPSPLPTVAPTIYCLPGQWIDVNAIQCRDCEIGKYSMISIPPFAENCSFCPAGTYNNQLGAAACTVCSKGKFSAPDHTYCRDCQGKEVIFSVDEN